MNKTGLGFALIVAIACGGGQDTGSSGQNIGESTKTGDDLDVSDQGDGDKTPEGDTETTGVDKGATDPPKTDGPPVTFVITNKGDDELVFSTDRGWQPVIFAYSGAPPKVKPILMFPKFCTAACDAADGDRCPYCPQPERVRDIRKAEKREVVAPGKTFEVPWDGLVHNYERTSGTKRGKKRRCECFKKEAVPAETYTVRACGLRLTKSSKSRSKLQCVDGAMTLPADSPIRVELSFPNPETKKK